MSAFYEPRRCAPAGWATDLQPKGCGSAGLYSRIVHLQGVRDVSRLTSFSGVLTGEPGKPRQGTFTITFAIYPVPEVGDPLWTETQQMTATPDGSRTEQPRSSASSGLPVTRLTHSIASAAYTSASHHLLFLRRSHSTGGVKDRDNYLGGEI